jgi:hypothetical protein
VPTSHLLFRNLAQLRNKKATCSICDIMQQLRTRTAVRKIVLSQGHVDEAERVIRDVVFVKNSDLQTHQQKNG